jgi:hypothetical protein
MRRHIFGVTLAVMASTAAAGSDQQTTGLLTPSASNAIIAPNAIGMPVGRVLLIRKGDVQCAAKLTEVKENRSGGWDLKYESYLFEGTPANGALPTTKEGKAYTRQPAGLGHLLTFTSTGKDYLTCGPVMLQLSGSAEGWWIYFYKSDRDSDRSVALAPTNWTDATQINFSHNGLAWYQFDEKRRRTALQLSSLQ